MDQAAQNVASAGSVRMNATCEDCRFYVPANNDPVLTHGKCYRYPPQIIGSHPVPDYAVFPRVGCSDWCGEFQRKKEPEVQ